MSPNPQFMFDFGSPNAFLSHEAIPAIEKRTGAKFEYVPILLGGIFKATNNKSPAETLAGVKNKREFHAIETERFVKRFGVKPYTWNPFFPVNTLNLMRAAVAAQMEGVFEKYVEAAFHHMWVEPKKMDDPEVAAKALASSGLDAAKLLAALAGRRCEGKADREHASRGRARRVRLADVLCRQGNVLRQGAVARSRGNGFGEIGLTRHCERATQSARRLEPCRPIDWLHPSRRANDAAPQDEDVESIQCKNATQPSR